MQTIPTTIPEIVPRDRHEVSRRLISPNALKVLYRLKDKGFIAYLVGGSVRDILLGREPKDFDIVTDATPGQLKRMFRNCRLIGRRFRLAHLHFADEIVEVATFRSSRQDEQPDEGPPAETEEARPPRHLRTEEGLVLRDNVFGTPEEDAFRRDFTVNALFYNIADFSIIDFVGGIKDLEQGTIRIIGDPKIRFTEDPVRMLRAVRFAATLGFQVEEETWKTILDVASMINRSTPPRLYEEVLKLFLLGSGERSYQLLRTTSLFRAMFPTFDAWLSAESEGFPHIRAGQALAWIDASVGEGKAISPPLLVALVFGQYIMEQAGVLMEQGMHFQQALDEATAQFIGDLAKTVLIPHRVAVQTRFILSYQLRFRKTPGRNPQGFIARPEFHDALAFLEFMATISEEDARLLVWWQRYIHELPSEVSEQGPHRRRRRRKKRKRKEPGSIETESVESAPR